MDNVSLKSDNDLLKDKLRSCSTLNTLHHDTQQEIELLNKQVDVKDNIIVDLKARLCRHERIYVTVGDNQSVVIGPSKSLVDGLCKEICKLKQKKNEMELKASRQTEEIQRLNVQLREKELELESVRCQPEHEKDQEIHRLRSALEERERTEATRAVLRTSLAEEADQMRSQLDATVKVCQELLARLEKVKKGGGEVDDQQTSHETTESSDMSGVNAQICELQEENQLLKQRVAYVQNLNTQWQKYDSSREDYIRGLCQRLKETSGQGLLPGLGSVGTALLHQEISRLNGTLKEKMSECARLSRGAEKTRRHDQERIQTLEHQVILYEEDFKSERADRERAHGQIQDLKEQVYQLKQQLHKQGRRQPLNEGTSRENRESVPMCRVHIGHMISSRRHKDSSEPLLRTAAAAAATPSPAWSECPAQSELQCPYCFVTYSERETTEYLNHCEECVKL
ncbi:TNFAIP3-interacting protein 2 isoform X2 [Cottoperca gobio]|uniref:TNFAIP3-interacting protein 2 isoform X2 n=1 Tax=Cottoperca gobio TaxID=56716 RepID=A0A6J2PY44_COTGO|nr:TNFAIP3-interacting protein 2 isoform X2 [Cottoperca gobio]